MTTTPTLPTFEELGVPCFWLVFKAGGVNDKITSANYPTLVDIINNESAPVKEQMIEHLTVLRDMAQHTDHSKEHLLIAVMDDRETVAIMRRPIPANQRPAKGFA